MTANKPETVLYGAPTFSLILVSHGGISSRTYTFTRYYKVCSHLYGVNVIIIVYNNHTVYTQMHAHCHTMHALNMHTHTHTCILYTYTIHTYQGLRCDLGYKHKGWFKSCQNKRLHEQLEVLRENATYGRMGFKCKHVIIENCDFSPSTQLLERNVYITHSINQYVARA